MTNRDFGHGIIYQGDCLDIMPGMEAASVDLILCDLPYGSTQCHWDSVIPFKPLWKQYKRLIKKNGAIVLTGSQPFTSALIMSNIEWFRYEWVYEKSHTGHLNCKKRPMINHENILVFGECLPEYYPQMSKKNKDNIRHFSESDHKGHNQQQPDSYGNFKRGVFRTIPINESYPSTIIKFNMYRNNIIHSTQKPVKLFEYLIKTYTNKGETILDNTIGSGTTAAAAYNTDRKWIGIEKDPEIYEKACQRIWKDTRQIRMFKSG